MSGWRELTKQNQLTKSSTGVTGTRVFLWDVNAEDLIDLPEVGDPWDGYEADGLVSPLFVKDMTRVFAGDHPNIRQWTVNYSALPRPDQSTSLPDLIKTVDLAGEFLNIGNKSGAKWSDNSLVKQDLFRRVVTMHIKIPRIFTAFEPFAHMVAKNMGCINSDDFLGFAPKTILFVGAPCTEIRDSKGIKRWKAELHFEVRRPILANGSYGTWEHLFNEVLNKWMTLKTPIYTTQPFTTELFAISSIT